MGKSKPLGYWNDVSNVLAEARNIVEKYNLDRLPSASGLGDLGYSSLSNAIQKHGGFPAFRDMLGEPSFKNLDYVLNLARKIIHENDFEDLPNSSKLRELGYLSFCRAVYTHHGGFINLRKKLGKPTRQGSWKDLGYVTNEAGQFMKEHNLDTFPSERVLRKLGYSSLGFAINKYHGGFHAFRIRLGGSESRKPKGYWVDLGNILSEAEDALEKSGLVVLPSQEKLRKLGYSRLANAIFKHHGGFRSFRKKLRKHMNPPSENEQLESMLEEYAGGEENG